MRSILTLAAAAATLGLATQAVAQTAPSTAAPATEPSASSATAASSDASVTVGQSVKDNTGAVIGQVSDVKPDASGKTTATIKMGADTFAVDTDRLAVQDGAAVINATQAEIKAMLSK